MSDLFYFLRKEPVDLEKHLPQYLFRDKLFAKVESMLSRQHENYRVKISEVAKQFFVETADEWSFADWEEYLGITPNKGALLEARRSSIRAKNLGGLLMNHERFQKFMEQFAPFGDVEVVELGGCELKLVIHNGNFYWDELYPALMAFLPAHLTFTFDIDIDTGEEPLNVVNVVHEANKISNRLSVDSPKTEIVNVMQHQRDLTRQMIQADSPSKDYKIPLFIYFQQHEMTKFLVKADLPERELTIDWFTLYLREHWLKFKADPLVKHYAGHIDSEFDYTDPNPDDPFPVQGSFLKLYFDFGSGTRVKTLTIRNLREGITDAEVKGLGAYTIANNLLISSSGLPVMNLKSAFYVTKTVEDLII